MGSLDNILGSGGAAAAQGFADPISDVAAGFSLFGGISDFLNPTPPSQQPFAQQWQKFANDFKTNMHDPLIGQPNLPVVEILWNAGIASQANHNLGPGVNDFWWPGTVDFNEIQTTKYDMGHYGSIYWTNASHTQSLVDKIFAWAKTQLQPAQFNSDVQNQWVTYLQNGWNMFKNDPSLNISNAAIVPVGTSSATPINGPTAGNPNQGPVSGPPGSSQASVLSGAAGPITLFIAIALVIAKKKRHG